MREKVSNHDAGKSHEPSHVGMWEVDTVFESQCRKMYVTRVSVPDM